MNEKRGSRCKDSAVYAGGTKTVAAARRDHLWSAAGIEKQRSAAGFILLRPGLHRSVVSYQSSGCAIPESGQYFTGRDLTCALFGTHAQNADLAVMEGVMGFYDGVAGVTA